MKLSNAAYPQPLCTPPLCTGCTACAHSCPVSAISMKEDSEGFLAPVVDESLCTGCGLCHKIPCRHPR